MIFLYGFLIWAGIVSFIVAVFAASRRNDRRVENDWRARQGLPPLCDDEDA